MEHKMNIGSKTTVKHIYSVTTLENILVYKYIMVMMSAF